MCKGDDKMKRTKKSYKLDRAKIALKQKGEVQYLRRIARALIKQCDCTEIVCGANLDKRITRYTKARISTTKVKRVCKALLKATK